MAFDAYFRFAIALVFVLALIGLLAWLARRFGVAGAFARPRAARRLTVVESLPLDARHRMVLVRRDAVVYRGVTSAEVEEIVRTSTLVGTRRVLVDLPVQAN